MSIYNAAWAIPLLPLLGALGSLGVETQRRAAQLCVVLHRPLVRGRRGRARRPTDACAGAPFISLLTFFSMTPPEGATFATQFTGAGRCPGRRALGELCRGDRLRHARSSRRMRVTAMRGEHGVPPLLLGLVGSRVLHHRFRAQPEPLRLADHVGGRVRQPVRARLARRGSERTRAGPCAAHRGRPHRRRHRADARSRVHVDQVRRVLVAARRAVRADRSRIRSRSSVISQGVIATLHHGVANTGPRAHPRDGHRLPRRSGGPQRAISIHRLAHRRCVVCRTGARACSRHGRTARPLSDRAHLPDRRAHAASACRCWRCSAAVSAVLTAATGIAQRSITRNRRVRRRVRAWARTRGARHGRLQPGRVHRIHVGVHLNAAAPCGRPTSSASTAPTTSPRWAGRGRSCGPPASRSASGRSWPAASG